MDSENKKIISITLDADVLKALDKLAIIERSSRSQTVNNILYKTFFSIDGGKNARQIFSLRL